MVSRLSTSAFLVAALVGGAVADPKADKTSERAADLVDVTTVVPDAVLDLRYATKHNFTGEVMYPVAKCLLRRAVATRLAKAATALRAADRRLVLWDCYRPLSIQKLLWKALPDARYVANPKTGSRHNRGAAIDCALADETGTLLPMPTEFDDTTDKKSHRAIALRGERGAEAKRLETAMLAAGFIGLTTEWWHFDAPDSANYALSDEPL